MTNTRQSVETSPAHSAMIDPKKTQLAKEYKHERPLTACHWSSDARYIFFGAEDNDVHRFEVATGQTTAFQAHESWVRAMASSPDGNQCFTGGYDGKLVWWNSTDSAPKPVRVVDAHKGWIRAIAVHPEGTMIASCGNDNAIRIWDAKNGVLMHELIGHDCHVYNASFTPDGSSIASCDLKARVRLWNSSTGQLVCELPVAEALYKYDKTFRADIGGARCIAFHPGGQQLALGGITNVSNAFAGIGEVAVVLMNVGEKKVSEQFETKAKHRGCAWGIDWHPSEFWIGLSGGGGGGWLLFWKNGAKHEFFQMKLKSDGRGMSLSPDKSQVAVAHSDMHLRTYKLS
ncbi:MAG: hypothetical protein KDA91_16135 [Planctomycetaceae bacterium]|nr:hypothetical protein [Planctomycetaceae bacterium]